MCISISKFILLQLVLFVSSHVLAIEDKKPIVWWTFDKIENGTIKDSVGQIEDNIEGNFRQYSGIRNSAVKFDGYTTVVTRKYQNAPVFSEAFTIEAWVAVAAFPWNWCPVVAHHQDENAGYAFEIGPEGELALQMFAGGLWRECIADKKITLKQWAHIAGTFDAAKGITIYLNGEVAGRLPFKGKLKMAEKIDLLIGMNHTKQKPAFAHRDFGSLPAWFSLDAIIDEVKIYDAAIKHSDIKQVYHITKPVSPPDFPPRILPSGPSSPGRFGAYYTKLNYYWEWDDLWRIADKPDIVVQFDNSKVKVVFWRGSRYSPAWVSEKNFWMADQSVEAWNDEEGCYEHMQDPRCQYSHVRILEDTDARVVIHWRYPLVSSHNVIWRVDEKTGWGCWIDEYYYIFPDQTGIRKVMWQKGSLGRPRQFQESIPFTGPGQVQGDIINEKYVTVANLKGETQDFYYVDNPPKETTKPIPNNPIIQRHNFKSKNKPFIIFETGGQMRYLKDMNRQSLSRSGSCSHWPVGLIPSDGRTNRIPDRAASFLGFPITYPVVHDSSGSRNWVSSLYGMGEKPMEELVTLARSWNHAPKLKILSDGYKNEGYDQSTRSYILNCQTQQNPSLLEMEVAASVESPFVNGCFVVKNCPESDCLVKIENRVLETKKDYQLGQIKNIEGNDLIVWVNKKSNTPFKISVIQK